VGFSTIVEKYPQPLGTAMDSREDRGCAIGRGIGLLDNSQQLGSVKWDMPSAPAPASVAGTSFPIIRCACRASIIRGPARASPSASRASRWSIRTASSAASNQSSRCQKHTIHTIHSIAICHEPDQERSRTPDNAEAPTMDQRFRRAFRDEVLAPQGDEPSRN
jgi:hypothetical protein